MAVESEAEVQSIQDSAGNPVPAASDADDITRLQGVDISSGGTKDVTPTLPDAPEAVVIIAEATAAFDIEIRYLDGNGNVDLDRTQAENGDLRSTDGSQLYVAHTPADKVDIEVRFVDQSSGSNTLDGRVMAR